MILRHSSKLVTTVKMKLLVAISLISLFFLGTEGQVIGSLSGQSVTNGDGSITITVTVSGGSPPADTFIWTLPDSSTISPGANSGTFSAGSAQVIGTNVRSFTLTMGDGLTSSPQSVEFRAMAGTPQTASWSSYLTFSFPAESIPGSVQGSLTTDQQTGVITIVAEVVGGTPAPNTYEWRVQQPDGTFQTYQAGQGGSTAVTTNANGNPSTTLTVTSPATIFRSFRLYVTYTDGQGNLRWWARRTWFA